MKNNCNSVFFLWMLLLPLGVAGQKPHAKKVLVELGSGIDLGEWLYFKGSINPQNFNDQGQDYTHYTAHVSLEMSILYCLGKWRLGGGISQSYFFENEMRSYQDQEYLIAKNSVKFFKYYSYLEYNLINRNKFTMSPQIRYGGFQVETIHPEKDNFGKKTFWEIGLMHTLQIQKLVFFMKPKYSSMKILPKDSIHDGERHKIYGVGLTAGVRIVLL